jgi:hypothetical protein
VYPFLNDRALELGEDTEHLEERPSGGGGCVNRLLFKVEVASSGVKFAKKADEILQRSAKPVYRPTLQRYRSCHARPLSEADRAPVVCRGLWRR